VLTFASCCTVWSRSLSRSLHRCTLSNPSTISPISRYCRAICKLNGTNSANIDGAVSGHVIGYFRRFYSLRPCVELGYIMDTKLNAPHDQRSEYLKKSLLLVTGWVCVVGRESAFGMRDKGNSLGRKHHSAYDPEQVPWSRVSPDPRLCHRVFTRYCETRFFCLPVGLVFVFCLPVTDLVRWSEHVEYRLLTGFVFHTSSKYVLHSTV
jgi:hypothetical protein